jgi:transcriptional regulator with XRE-family HTH domain
MVQRSELGAFFRARREAADPVACGFPVGSRRRTPGLRREELAQLAGLSLTWYTWLEQARDITVSRQVIASLARVLELSPTERAHVFTLAGLAPPPADPRPDPALERLVRALHPNPAYVANPWWDLVSYNDAYASLFGGLRQRPPAERNILWITFTEARGTGLLVDWERQAQSMAGQFRVALARYPQDPRGPELLATMCAADDEFRRLWEQHTVRPPESARKRLMHPELGRIDLDYTKLRAAVDERLTLITFLPADAETAAKLETLR